MITSKKYIPLRDRLHDAIKVDGKTGCWIWQRPIAAHYATVYGKNGKHSCVHRIMYEKKYGKVPKGLELDHLCKRKSCVNPNHLEAVTHQVNMQRSIDRSKLKKTCSRGHRFVPPNSYIDKNSNKRICRKCYRLRDQKFKKRKKRLQKLGLWTGRP